MGLTYRGTDIRTANRHFDLTRGYAETPEVRGEDVTIPGKEGRTEMTRKRDRRLIELRGYVRGTGATLTDQQQSWRSNTDTLLALMKYDLASGALVLTPPELGLPSGSKTIQAKCINQIGGPILGGSVLQFWTFELEAIADPPEWA